MYFQDKSRDVSFALENAGLHRSSGSDEGKKKKRGVEGEEEKKKGIMQGGKRDLRV